MSREEQSRDTFGFLGGCLGAKECDWFLGAGKELHPQKLQKETQPCPHLDFSPGGPSDSPAVHIWFPLSKMNRKIRLVLFSSHQVCGNLLQHQQKTNMH